VSKSKTSKSKAKASKPTPKATNSKKPAPKAAKVAKKPAKPAPKKSTPKQALKKPSATTKKKLTKSAVPKKPVTQKPAPKAKKVVAPAKKISSKAAPAPIKKAAVAPMKKPEPVIAKKTIAKKVVPAKKISVSIPAIAKPEPVKISTGLVVSSTGMPRIASLPSAPPPPPKASAKKPPALQLVSEPIAAAKAPVLSKEKPMAIKSGALFYDSHMHTPLCKHAWGDPEEYCAQALKSGLKGIIFTCHCPMPDGYWPSIRMSDSEFDTYVAIVQRAAAAYKGKLDVCLGLESEYFPGYEKWIENLHQRVHFDFILGAVHWQAKEYLNKFESGTIENFRRTYFDQLAISAETGLYDCVAHPDLVKNYHPDSWCFAIIKNSVTTALDRIAKTGVAMELNTSGLNKSYSEMNPGNEMLRMMAERKIPIVLGSDAHKPVRVGEHFITALNNLAEAGFENVSYFKNRERIDLKINDVISSIKRAADANA